MIRVGFLLGLALLAAAPAAANGGAACPPAGPEAELSAPLPRLAQAVARGGPIEVLTVGLGSMRAGGVEGPFAQAFREALARGLPGRTINITAVPTPGMVARDAADRMRRGVAEGEPVLVIWRTGLNDALAVTDPARFARIVQRAAAWVSAQNADLVLVDLAYTGAGAHEPTYRRYVDALAQVGRDGEAAVFRRYAITEAWYRAGVLPPMAASEACLAEALAAAILRRVAP
ncbi:MAG: hypothetical protein N2Z67_09330 [Acetobacteraceae bacterium]|nr:hypothetical protein [Acetobacteraceae bacterium]